MIDGGTGDDQLYGGDGNDLLSGNEGNDSINGGYGLDIIIGGLGNDTLSGSDENDILVDGYGTDSYSGGNGDDLLVAIRDNSNDTLSGGSGADVFVFIPADGISIGNDIIRDFSTTQNDRIEIGGSTTMFQLAYLDTDGNGRQDATSIQLTDESGTSLGSITVTGNLLSTNAIVLTGIPFYENALIPDTIEY